LLACAQPSPEHAADVRQPLGCMALLTRGNHPQVGGESQFQAQVLDQGVRFRQGTIPTAGKNQDMADSEWQRSSILGQISVRSGHARGSQGRRDGRVRCGVGLAQTAFQGPPTSLGQGQIRHPDAPSPADLAAREFTPLKLTAQGTRRPIEEGGGFA